MLRVVLNCGMFGWLCTFLTFRIAAPAHGRQHGRTNRPDKPDNAFGGDYNCDYEKTKHSASNRQGLAKGSPRRCGSWTLQGAECFGSILRFFDVSSGFEELTKGGDEARHARQCCDPEPQRQNIVGVHLPSGVPFRPLPPCSRRPRTLRAAAAVAEPVEQRDGCCHWLKSTTPGYALQPTQRPRQFHFERRGGYFLRELLVDKQGRARRRIIRAAEIDRLQFP